MILPITIQRDTAKIRGVLCYILIIRLPRLLINLSLIRKHLKTKLIIETVGSAASAFKRLHDLKTEKQFDMFRGQRKPWPIVSHRSRLLGADQASATRRLSIFESWVANVAGMHELVNEPDKLLAVAQHYGIATRAAVADEVWRRCRLFHAAGGDGECTLPPQLRRRAV